MSKKIVNVNGANATAPVPGVFRDIETALDQIRDRAYSLWERYGNPIGTGIENWLQAERELFEIPDFELCGKDTAYILEVAVPGYTPDQLIVTVDDGWIALQGKSEQRMEKKGEVEAVARKEMFRRIELPSGIDLDKVEAVLENGKLRVTMPKIPVAAKPPVKAQPAEKARAAAA